LSTWAYTTGRPPPPASASATTSHVTINAKWAALAAVRRLVNENDTYDWRKLNVAELKAMLVVVQADTRGSKQALVDRCLDEDIALKIKEQLLWLRPQRRERVRGRRGRKVRQTSRMGRKPARITPDFQSCIRGAAWSQRDGLYPPLRPPQGVFSELSMSVFLPCEQRSERECALLPCPRLLSYVTMAASGSLHRVYEAQNLLLNATLLPL